MRNDPRTSRASKRREEGYSSELFDALFIMTIVSLEEREQGNRGVNRQALQDAELAGVGGKR